MTSRWLATRRFGPTSSACCWTVREQAARRSCTRRPCSARAGCSAIASCIRRCTLGRYEIYWHRPLVAYLAENSQPQVLVDGPLGYLTAYDADRPKPARAMELWPRLLARPAHVAAVEAFWATPEHHEHRISRNNARKLLDAWQLRGERPLPRSFARALLNLPHEETLDNWLSRLEGMANSSAAGRELAAELRRRIEPEPASGVDAATAAKLSGGGAAHGGGEPAAVPTRPRRSPFTTPPGDLSKWPIGEPSPSWPTAST